jgi:hypothetical protein
MLKIRLGPILADSRSRSHASTSSVRLGRNTEEAGHRPTQSLSGFHEKVNQLIGQSGRLASGTGGVEIWRGQADALNHSPLFSHRQTLGLSPSTCSVQRIERHTSQRRNSENPG